jgi:hypothetical protein
MIAQKTVPIGFLESTFTLAQSGSLIGKLFWRTYDKMHNTYKEGQKRS